MESLYLPQLLLQVAPRRRGSAGSPPARSGVFASSWGGISRARPRPYREPVPDRRSRRGRTASWPISIRANFFHWITEELVKVAVLEAGSGFHRALTCFTALPDFAGQFLEFMGVSPDRLDRPARAHTPASDPRPTSPPITALQLHRHPSLFSETDGSMILASVAPIASAPTRRLWMDRRLGVNNPGRDCSIRKKCIRSWSAMASTWWTWPSTRSRQLRTGQRRRGTQRAAWRGLHPHDVHATALVGHRVFLAAVHQPRRVRDLPATPTRYSMVVYENATKVIPWQPADGQLLAAGVDAASLD